MIFQIFGPISNPLPADYGDVTESTGGLAGLLSNIINFITVAAGLYALFNLVMAGLNFITSRGDPKGVDAAKQKIYMSIIGLVIIAASFLIAAILGKILFDDYGFILNPTISGPGSI